MECIRTPSRFIESKRIWVARHCAPRDEKSIIPPKKLSQEIDMLLARYEKNINAKVLFLELHKGASPDKEPCVYLKSNAFPEGLPMDWRLTVSLYNEPKLVQLKEAIDAWVSANEYAETFRCSSRDLI